VAGAAEGLAEELLGLRRFEEARPYLRRATAMLDRPASENVNWLIHQVSAHELQAQVDAHFGDWESSRAELQKSATAAEVYLGRAPGHPYAMIVEANANYELAAALQRAGMDGGCELLRKSVDRYRELEKMGSPIKEQWNANRSAAEATVQGCR
jgi:hypothetical protein